MSRASLPRHLTRAQAEAIAAGFVSRRRALHGDATMTAPPVEQQPPAGDPPAETPPAVTPPKDEPKLFTQEELDAFLGKRLSEKDAAWQKRLDDATALAGKNETEKLTIERDQAKAQVGEVTKAAAKRIAATEAKVAAQSLGAKDDRLKAVIGQADLTAAIDDDGNVDETKVEAAIKKVLDEYPEWKKAAGTGPSSSGNELNGKDGNKPTFTRAQIEAMSPEEVARRIDEINEAVADGRVTG